MQAGIEALYDEGQHDAAEQEEDAIGDDQAGGGAHGGADRRERLVHRVDLGCAEAGLDFGGLQALLEGVVEGAVLLIFTLQQGVAHHVVALAVGLGLSGVELLLRGLFSLLGGEIVFACLGLEAGVLRVDLLRQFVDLLLHGLHARKVWAEGLVELSVLRLEGFAFCTQTGEFTRHGARRGLNGLVDGVRVHVLDHQVPLLSGDARDLRGAFGAEQLVQGGLQLIVLGIEGEHAELALQLQHLLLGALQLAFEVVEIGLEPVGDPLGLSHRRCKGAMDIVRR